MAKILCVDDESNVVKLKCAILEAAGHQVTGCTSAKEAIDHISKTGNANTSGSAKSQAKPRFLRPQRTWISRMNKAPQTRFWTAHERHKLPNFRLSVRLLLMRRRS